MDKATRQRLRSGQRIPLSELRKHLSVRQQKLVELFFGQRIEELEEKSVSLPKIDEEEKCQPVDEKEEFDVVSQADDASQEEDIEEESIPEEDEENTPHVAGIDDAAMGEVSSRPSASAVEERHRVGGVRQVCTRLS